MTHTDSCSQTHDIELRGDGHRFRNVDGGHFELLGKAELAVGEEVLRAKDVLCVLGSHHHGRVLVGGAPAHGALQADLVEEEVAHLH